MDKFIQDEELLMKEIYQAALRVHRQLGPGLLESVYETCLHYELIQRGIFVERQKPISVIYNGIEIYKGFKLDLLVENTIIVELKSVGHLLPVHQAQLMTYMKLTGKELGYLMNFNEYLLKNGVKRYILREPVS